MWTSSQYINPSIQYEKPNFKNLLQKIEWVHLANADDPDKAAKATQDLIEDCFARTDIAPATADQLITIASKLRNDRSFWFFHQKLEQAANKRLFGVLDNTYTQFFRNNVKYQELLSKNFDAVNMGEEAVGKLIKLLRNKKANISYKTAELISVLKENTASQAQFDRILAAVQDSELIMLMHKFFRENHHKSRLNQDIVETFYGNPRINAMINNTFRNPKAAGAMLNIYEMEALKTQGLPDSMVDAITEARRHASHGNPLQHWNPWTWFEKNRQWLGDEIKGWKANPLSYPKIKRFITGIT